MARSSLVLVEVAKKETYIQVDGAEPTKGNIPLTFHMWGFLMGINPDGSHGGLARKPINLVVNGIVVWSGATGGAPLHPNGWVDLAYTFTETGIYEVYVEFPGDAEWAGCEHNGETEWGRDVDRW